MNRIILLLVVSFTVVSIWSCNGGQGKAAVNGHDNDMTVDTVIVDDGSKDTLAEQRLVVPPAARALIAAYPGKILGYESDSLLLFDGTKLPFDDGQKKDFIARLDHSDAEDMLKDVYDTAVWTPAYLQDAGRSRCEPLFRKLYGDSERDVSKRLETVNWFGQGIRFTGECGAADSLRAVAKEFEARPELRKYLTGASSFYWRKVRGANRLSAHSYGIAVDINVGHSDYWLWAYPKCSETDEIGYKNRIPKEVVKVFERHGFIWGGRWYHFDTMHFEYRPEFHAYNRLKAAGHR